METLWAGWRSTYVSSPGDDEECVFCRLPNGDDDDAFILERGEHAYSVLNIYPYTTGHVIVGPYRHVAEPGDLSPAEIGDVWRLLVRSQEACQASLGSEGFNWGANLGRIAGSSIPDHLHMQLVPRWTGDTNYVTTIGNARVLPEDLPDTWARLRAALANLG